MKSTTLALLAIALGVTGCSSSSTGSTAVIARTAAAECNQLLQCDQQGGTPDRALVSSAADCNALAQTVLAADFNLQAYIDAGTVRVDAAAYSACLSAMAADPCVPMNEIAPCRSMYVGTLIAGAACRSDAQCVSHACTGSANQCGVCLDTAALGTTCDPNNNNCATSTMGIVRCQPNAGGGSGTCVLEPPAYLTVTLGESCANNGGIQRYCASPYYCDATDTCAQRAVADATCDPNVDGCAFGTTCAQTGVDFTCLPVVNVTTAASPCGDLATGAIGRCDRSKRLFCDQNTSLCATLAGTGAVNSDCLVASDCDAGLVCVIGQILDTPGYCATTNKALSTTCEIDAECASHLCRQPAAGGARVCVAAACP